MDVGITTFRAELSRWIEKVRFGEEVVVTDRGVPVVRLVSVATTPLLEDLVRRGVLGRPVEVERPAARGVTRARATGPVAALVADQRD